LRDLPGQRVLVFDVQHLWYDWPVLEKVAFLQKDLRYMVDTASQLRLLMIM
jgi:hypothetical protein